MNEEFERSDGSDVGQWNLDSHWIAQSGREPRVFQLCKWADVNNMD